MIEPMFSHTDGPSSSVSGYLLEQLTLFKADHRTKEVRINQIPITISLNPDTPHFVPHLQEHSMATVGNNSTNTQINTCHSQPHKLCQTDNAWRSSIPLVILCHPGMILI